MSILKSYLFDICKAILHFFFISNFSNISFPLGKFENSISISSNVVVLVISDFHLCHLLEKVFKEVSRFLSGFYEKVAKSFRPLHPYALQH